MNRPSVQSGIPKYYANWDANFWVVSPTPNAAYAITMAYIKQPDIFTLVHQAQQQLIYLINIKIYFCMLVW